jgi:hypothetical protein
MQSSRPESRLEISRDTFFKSLGSVSEAKVLTTLVHIYRKLRYFSSKNVFRHKYAWIHAGFMVRQACHVITIS